MVYRADEPEDPIDAFPEDLDLTDRELETVIRKAIEVARQQHAQERSQLARRASHHHRQQHHHHKDPEPDDDSSEVQQADDDKFHSLKEQEQAKPVPDLPGSAGFEESREAKAKRDEVRAVELMENMQMPPMAPTEASSADTTTDGIM